MKKAILTFGLLSLVMVLTSFTDVDTGGQTIEKPKKTDDFTYETGGQSIDKGKKTDDYTYDTGGQSIDKGKKLDD